MTESERNESRTSEPSQAGSADVTQAAGERGRGSERASAAEQIRMRAYELYLERGGAPGDEQEDWLRAEREHGEREVRRDTVRE